MLKLGWKAGTEQYAPLELLDYAVAAEQAGFDTLDVSDHFHPWSESGQSAFTWTWLGAAAVKTARIEMGTGVTCPVLRYHPTVVAQAAATLGVMAPGRAYLAVGTGEALNEYAATGNWPEYEQRQDMLAEAIDLIRELWAGGEVSFDGEYFQTHKARLFTAPAQPIPLYVSTLSPESAEFAGTFGDGLITVGGEEPDAYRRIIEEFDRAARAEGKDPARLPKMIELNAAFTDDPAAVIAAAKEYWAGAFVPALFAERIYTPAMSAKNGQVVGADTIAQKTCISSDPRVHVDFARQYVDLGFTHLIYHCPGPDQRAFLQAYGREVLPRIREAIGQKSR